MKYRLLIRGTVLTAAALAAGSAIAQTRPADSGGPAPVVTDVGPAPAQERSSLGAIVLEKSPVRAQRQNALQRAASRPDVPVLGRGAVRVTSKAQRDAALTQTRVEEAAELYRRGAGGLTGK